MDSNGRYDLTDILNELPTPIDNNADSNNAKLLSVLADDMVNMQELIDQINLWRDISEAQGAWLDKIGHDWGVSRDGYDDGFYRFMIKTKQLQRQTDGTYSSLIKLIAKSLGANYSEINVKAVPDEPNAITVTNIPVEYIDSQQKEAMVLQRIRKSVVAGVRVANIQFQTVAKSTLYLTSYSTVSQMIASTMNAAQPRTVTLSNSKFMGAATTFKTTIQSTMEEG